MFAVRRIAAPIAAAGWVALFGLTARSVSPDALPTLLLAPSLLTPLAAALACLWAAAASRGADKRAWRNFASGCFLYLLGNSAYAFFGLYEVQVGFPTLPEFLFFAMAGFFTVGVFQYGALREQVSRAQIYNFSLILVSVALAALFLLHGSIDRSQLTVLGTVAAVAYPVLWFSVSALAVVCLVFYVRPARRWPLAILAVAFSFEAAADFIYAKDLMAGLPTLGSASYWLWGYSSALIIWAALEQRSAARQPLPADETLPRQREGLEAMVPAVTAMIALAGFGVGEFGAGHAYSMIIPAGILALIFAATLGAREHWMLSMRRNLTDAVEKSAAELSQNRQQLHDVLESTTDSVLVLDRDWCITFFNGRAASLLGRKLPVQIGRPVSEYVPQQALSALRARFAQALRDHKPAEFELRISDTEWWGIQLFPSPEGMSVFFHDVSEARRAREEITHQAHHDALTGIANRVVVRRELEAAIAEGRPTAAIFIDLDYFKDVNDTLGHPVGDALLRAFAHRLRNEIGNLALVGRLGGDEFAVVPRHLRSQRGLTELAERIRDILGEPITAEGATVVVHGSMGIALAPDDANDADEILRLADIALYEAKATSRGSYRFFERKLEEAVQRRQRLKADLRMAIARNELALEYQPVVNLATGAVVSFEALLRWRHPVHGDVAPADFVAVAEETGLIVEIGAWAVRQACAAAATWPVNVRVAVNLSSVQFGDQNLFATVKDALDASGLPPSRLELEITESALLKESRPTLMTLMRLRDAGIGIALDDFGTGYASLGYLQRFAFNRIKIDRSFVSSERHQALAIMKAVTALGHELGAKVTAEGVESQEYLDRARRVGCDEAQGFHISMPLPATEVTDFIKQRNAAVARRSRSSGAAA